MAWTPPWNVLGINVSGDVGPLTIYTDRYGRKVVYDKSPPDKPASVQQQRMRDRFKLAVSSYLDLSASAKASLETVTLGESFCLTGLNVWISARLSDGNSNLQALAQKYDVTIPAAEFIP